MIGQKQRLNKSGFTIVELLVVVVIIGILAAVATISYVGISNKAYTSILQLDLSNATKGLELSRFDNNDSYPSSQLSANLKPSPGTTFRYQYSSQDGSYCLSAINQAKTRYYLTSQTKKPALGDCPFYTYATAWGGTNIDSFYSIVEAGDGGFVSVGLSNSFGGTSQVIVVKYDKYGTISWKRNIGDAGSDQAYSVIATKDGGFAVAGGSSSYTGSAYSDLILYKFDSGGGLSWTRTWGGTASDGGRMLAEASDGSLIVVGTTNSYYTGGTQNNDIAIVKYSSTGVFAWNKTLGGTGTDTAFSIAVLPDDGFVIAGQYYDGASSQALIAKYTSAGVLSWTRLYGGSYSDVFNSIILDSNGNYVLAGDTDPSGAATYDAMMVSYDSNGNLNWAKKWGGAGDDRGASIVESHDGEYVMVGYDVSFTSGGWDAFIVKYSATNASMTWQKAWGTTNNEQLYSVKELNDGNYLAVGDNTSYTAGNTDALSISFNSSGNVNGCIAPKCSRTIAGTLATLAYSSASVTPSTTTPAATKASQTPTVIDLLGTNTVIQAYN